MAITDRPFVGSWQLNNKTLVRHAPDAVVLINGFTEFASCVTCNKKLDLQKYITSVSCDVSKDPITSATVSLSVPKHATDVFDRDGNFILTNGLEVIILMKGYYPTKNYAGLGIDNIGDFDPDEVSVYPYYQVFRGVVTGVSHSYSGGFYSATLSCANLLHFWQNLKVSVNGAAFGRRPANSGNNVHLSGHKFTSANPYSIIYTLVKVGFGAAFGVEFVYAQKSNIAAKSDTDNEYQYAHAAEWWEKRWQSSAGRLRMYGMDGRLFNGYEQAYLGRWIGSSKTFNKQVVSVIESLKDTNSYDLQGSREVKARLRELGYDRLATTAGVYSTQNKKGNVITEDILKMQAFVYDISKQGSVNMFETEYASKLDIVNQVLEVTGFEFYQDADGDFVFKPPMYNLDTRQDPVYVIKDRDLISIDESQSEPNATIVKGTGSHWGNIDTGINGWAGVGAVYIDYRLVAQYGYREESFDTKYFTSKQAIFISCVNRLDLANLGTTSGSIEIPLRPELKPGYPVYVESKDCFYYVESVSHTLTYGGDATTSISWVGKRSKWCPPVKSRADNKMPTMDDVRLDAPGEYPPQPILMYPPNADVNTPPRMVGFPNVIMALDINKLNYESVDVDEGKLSADSFVELILSSGLVLRHPTQEDAFLLQESSNQNVVLQLQDIKTEFAQQRDTSETTDNQLGTSVSYLINQITLRYGGVADIENPKGLINYLSLQSALKTTFDPNNNLTGRYRYYSCSHPNAEDQAPYNLIIDQESASPVSTSEPENGVDSSYTTIKQFKNRSDGLGVEMVEVPTSQVRGVKVLTLSNKGGSNSNKRVVSTSDVYAITFGPHIQKKKIRITKVDPKKRNTSNFSIAKKSLRKGISGVIYENALEIPPNESLLNRVIDKITEIENAVETLKANLQVDSSKISRAYDKYLALYDNPSLEETVYDTGKDPNKVLLKLSDVFAKKLLVWISAVFGEGLVKLKRNSNLYVEYMGYRAEFFNSIFGAGTVKDPLDGESFVYVEDPKQIEYYTPIFPVSDSSGYSVVGTLPYGRGLTIDTYAKLFQAEKSDEETIIEGQGISTSTMAEVEKLLIAYVATNGNDNVIGEFSNETVRAAQAALDVNSEEELLETLETLNADGDLSPKLKIRNVPVTSYFRGQRVLGDVGARQLADLDFESGICACKGADGAFFLQAFNQDLELVYGQGAMQEYLENQAIEQTKVASQARIAYSGQDSTILEETVNPTNLQALLTPTQGALNQGLQEIDDLFGEDE